MKSSPLKYDVNRGGKLEKPNRSLRFETFFFGLGGGFTVPHIEKDQKVFNLSLPV